MSTSRRSVLAGLVAAPVATLPAIAAPSVHPDAELLKAGAEFDLLAAMHADARRRSQPHWDAQREAYKRLPRPATDADYKAVWDAVEAQFPLPKPSCDEICGMIDAPWRAIVNIPARTLEGVLVKARVVRWDHFKAWDGRPVDDLDCDEQSVRSLVEAIEALAVRA